MTALPILYSFRRCPYAMRARMAIAVSGVRVELREVVLRDKPVELLDASPKATVPVVVTDGTVIEESLEVMRWALAQHDPEDWLDRCDEALIAVNDGPFKQALDRYKYPHRYDLESGFPYRDKAMAFLQDLEQRLSQDAHIHGDQRGFSDIAIFPFVRQFAATDRDWFDAQPLPSLQRWMKQNIESDLFDGVMHRYPQWRPRDIPTLFPG